jgi:hypothetical protein
MNEKIQQHLPPLAAGRDGFRIHAGIKYSTSLQSKNATLACGT